MNGYDVFNALLVGFFAFICMPAVVGVGIFIVNLRRYRRCKSYPTAEKAMVFGLVLTAMTFPMFYMGAKCLIDFFID